MLDQVREDGFWRVLTDEEKDENRKWAREHYTPGEEVNHRWHPVVKEECEKMNDEGGIIAKMGDFAISAVSTRKVSIELFNTKESTKLWKWKAKERLSLSDGDASEATKDLAAIMRDYYSTRPLDGDGTIYDDLLGWALTTVDWPAIASDFVDAVEYE